MLKKNLFFNIILSVSQFIFPLVSFPYASRILGPHGVGEVNFIDSFTQYFVLLAALGIPFYGVREIAKSKESEAKISKTFSEIFLIHIISAICFSVVFLTIALFLPKLHLHFDLVIVGVIILLFNVLSFEWFFQGKGDFSYITIRSLIVKSLSLVLLFLFLKHDSKPIIYYIIVGSAFVLNGLSNILYIFKSTRVNFKDLNLKQHIKPLILILGSSMAISIYVFMDNIILGFLTNETYVGYYSTSVRIVKIPLALISAISTVIIPQISSSFHNGDHDNITSLIDKSFTYVCLIGIPMSFGMFVISDFLVGTFAGSQFDESVVILKFLSPIIFFIGLSNVFGIQLLTPIGKEKYLLYSVTVGMLISLILNILLIPKFSYIGSAIANLFTEAIVAFMCFIYARKYTNIKLNVSVLFQSLIASIFFIPTSLLIRKLDLGFMVEGSLIIVSCLIIYSISFVFIFKNEFLDTIRYSLLKKLKKQ